MIRNAFYAVAAVAAALIAAPAGAATKFPVAVDFTQGPVDEARPGRDNPLNALSGPDGVFLSLGFGGLAVFDFGETLSSSLFSITESTTTCFGSPVCGNHAESAKIFYATSYTWGSFDISGFTELAEVGNAESQPSFQTLIPGSFRYIAVLDTSPMPTASFDGYDIDVLSATPIPVPAALPLLATAFGLVGWLGRRRAA